MSDRIYLGHINGLFGVVGWLKVFSDTQPRENIVSYKKWWLKDKQGKWQEYSLQQGKRHGKNVIVKLAEVDDRDMAALLIGCQIAVDRESLPTLANNEFYWTDLIGCAVQDSQGNALGLLTRLFETGAHDVMVVKTAGGEELLIPWVTEHFILEVDLAGKRIVADWDAEWGGDGQD